jgi:fibronectin-binding autotransporter adhesin
LTGINTYSGGTTVEGLATLVAGSDNALGTGSVDLFGGTLMIPAGVTLSNAVNFVIGGVVDNAGTLNNNVLDGS